MIYENQKRSRIITLVSIVYESEDLESLKDLIRDTLINESLLLLN